MYIEELKEGELKDEHGQAHGASNKDAIVIWDAKRVLVGAGARALFYPTLLYNLVRNKVQSEFRWWDKVDEFILLGAVPFPTDVPLLKAAGVCGVVTLNEPYETLVPSSLYHVHHVFPIEFELIKGSPVYESILPMRGPGKGFDHLSLQNTREYKINHLVIPTRDYLFAPAHRDICLAVDFIHGKLDNASCGKTTYVHCKAGRGRSTTIVLCYLVKYRHMTPLAAFEHVRSIRPRVLLADAQWQAVLSFYDRVKKLKKKFNLNHFLKEPFTYQAYEEESVGFEDGSMVVVTESDLDGYNEILESSVTVDKKRLSELKLPCRFQFAGEAAISTISCLWVRYQAIGKVSRKTELGSSMGDVNEVGVEIHVY